MTARAVAPVLALALLAGALPAAATGGRAGEAERAAPQALSAVSAPIGPERRVDAAAPATGAALASDAGAPVTEASAQAAHAQGAEAAARSDAGREQARSDAGAVGLTPHAAAAENAGSAEGRARLSGALGAARAGTADWLFDRGRERGDTGSAPRETAAPAASSALSARQESRPAPAPRAVEASPATPLPLPAQRRSLAASIAAGLRSALASWRQIAGYSSLMAAAFAIVHQVLAMGQTLVATGSLNVQTVAHVAASPSLVMHPLALMAAQVAAILLTSFGVTKVMSKLGQPRVIGQIVGGLLLGPSVLGALFPAAAATLFPGAVILPALQAASLAGLLLFMFIAGLEIDGAEIKKMRSAVGLVSYTSILAPFVMGLALALVLFTGFAPVGVPFLSFALFMGVATSITAFPVLLHILKERGMSRTQLGSIAMASAAINDVVGWVLLGFVIAMVTTGAGMMAMAPTIAASLLYVGAMLWLVRPGLALVARRLTPGKVEFAVTAAVSGLVMAVSALIAHVIGIHALFGAFLAGVVMPRGAGLHARLGSTGFSRFESVVTGLFLPLFFAQSGLRTVLGLLSAPSFWGVVALVTSIAVLGKLGSSALAARWSGLDWRDSLKLGALMNTRGLMELVVLNIGYDLGVISGPLFAVLVVMAIATTMMTGPLLSGLQRLFKETA